MGILFRYLQNLVAAVCLAVLSAFVPAAAEQAPPRATGVAISVQDGLTRFEAQLSYAVGYDVYVLADPFRVVLDLPEIAFAAPEDTKAAAGALITGYRLGRLDDERSRIVLDAAGPVLIERSYIVRETDDKPARLVVELVSTNREEFDRLRTAEQPAPPPAPPQQVAVAEQDLPDDEPPAPVSALDAARDQVRQAIASMKHAARPVPIPRPRPNRDAAPAERPKPEAKPAGARRVVVIDPGHGGIDPGATSRRGTKEKDVVLRFARQLRDRLKASGKYKVVMTRDGDNFISLRDRVRIARKNAADLFIAIHADSIRGRGARGATIYTVSEKASDREAAELARKENRADIIAGVDLGEENEDITGILIDLAQRETNNYSLFFAKKALNRIRRVTKVNKRPLRSAGFRVLKAPDVPSVLFELGYLSSRDDEKRLTSKAWRSKTARAMARAIDGYFSNRIAAQQ